MALPVLKLRPGRDRSVLGGHPWVFSGALVDLDKSTAPGSLVELRSFQGDFLGVGYANPNCGIAVRVLSRESETVDAAFFRRRVSAALELRRNLLPADTDAFRLVNGEGDLLPGFIVDVYGPLLVLQCLTAGAAALKPLLLEALLSELKPEAVYERSAGAVRREEGLGPEEGLVAGTLPRLPVTIRENGLRFLVDVREGQKTGFFLDQRDNRALLRQIARGRRVLNAFAYTGAFSVYAAAGGAREVVAVESSPRAVELGHANWSANDLDVPCEPITADVFEYLRGTDREFDLLVLDPPALVKRRNDTHKGLRAYKDLHLWALRRAVRGAYLLTFSCSQHVPPDLFRKVVQGAAIDAARPVQVLRALGPGTDHPLALAHPEGEYLKGLLLRVP